MDVSCLTWVDVSREIPVAQVDECRSGPDPRVWSVVDDEEATDYGSLGEAEEK